MPKIKEIGLGVWKMLSKKMWAFKHSGPGFLLTLQVSVKAENNKLQHFNNIQLQQ